MFSIANYNKNRGLGKSSLYSFFFNLFFYKTNNKIYHDIKYIVTNHLRVCVDRWLSLAHDHVA